MTRDYVKLAQLTSSQITHIKSYYYDSTHTAIYLEVSDSVKFLWTEPSTSIKFTATRYGPFMSGPIRADDYI